MMTRDARGESGDDRERDEFDHRAEPREPEGDRISAGHQGRDHQAVDPVALDDPVDDHHERAGRPADLHPRSAEHGDQESGDDRGVEPALRRDAAGDGERDSQRQRDDPDDDTGKEIAMNWARS